MGRTKRHLMSQLEEAYALPFESNVQSNVITKQPKNIIKMEIIKLTDHLWQTDQVNELATALLEFQKDFNKASLKKDAKNQHLRNSYISLDNLLNTIRPILSKNGLVVTQDLAGDFITTTIYHTSGQFRGSSMPFNPMSGNKGTNNLQQIGGGITYAKRYALSAVLSISVDTDDDGNSMSTKTFSKQKSALPVGMYQFAAKAYERDGNFKKVEEKYIVSEEAKNTILSNLKK
jgi:hypothetical protein